MTDNTTPFHISAAPGRVRVLFEGHEVADSDKALLLREAGRDPVYYFPRDDVQMSVLKRNDHGTTNEKGAVSWFTIMRDAKIVEDVAWSYEKANGETELIEGYIAFMPEHVEFEADTTVEPVRKVPPMDPPYA
jgi:uncharacterized protein (DUF427 family)